MITDRAKAGFAQLVQAGLKSGLQTAGGGCVVETVPTLDKIRDKKIVVLTVSSYLLRLITIIYFRNDAATRAHFAGPDGTQQTFLDRVSECGNICCGSLNRELGRYFPHVGMPTPNIIDRDCMRHVDLLGTGLLRHFKVNVTQDLALHASLCVTDHGLVDFEPAAVAQAEKDTLMLPAHQSIQSLHFSPGG